MSAVSAVSAEDLADALWVARFAGRGEWADESSGAEATSADGEDRRPPTPTARPVPGSGTGPHDTPLHAAVHPRRDDAAPGMRHPGPGLAAAPVRLGRERSLAEMRALGRALRPLKRVRGSAERQLDEEATARAMGETALLLPAWRAGPERRFEVDLVIDIGPSMVIWRQLASDVQGLFEGHGAFRVVRTLCLDTVDGSMRLSWSRRAGRGAAPRSVAPERLADPTGRRLILLLTDGMGPLWDSPALDAALRRWSRTQPVAVLQVLPHRLWHRTRLTTEAVSARAIAPGATTPAFKARRNGGRTQSWVPVLELAPDWIEPWAKVIAGTAAGWTPLWALPVGRGPSGRPPRRRPKSADTAEELVERFRGEASVSAFELAGYLAAAPLVPPVMHLVQRTMMPRSNSAHLAEVFLSGLIAPADDDLRPGDDPDLLLYDFLPGVREVLLATLTRRESMSVLDVIGRVSGKVAGRFGGSLSFRALVPTVEAGGEWRIPAGSAPFARVAAGVLASFGSEHRAVAEALTGAAEEPPMRAGGSDAPARAMRSAALARAATVSLHQASAGAPLLGSGFFVAPGWVLTSAEVVPGGRGSVVQIDHDGRLIHGTVEWRQSSARYGSESVSGLALIRLWDAPDHACVWLTERTIDSLLEEVAYSGRHRHRAEVVGVSRRCPVRGRVGDGGVLVLEPEAAPARSAAGGPVVDPVRGEVIGVLTARRGGEKADLMVPVTELRRDAGDVYHGVVRAHDTHHAENPAGWRYVLSDVGTGSWALTPDWRIALLRLLAELQPPASTASLERLVRRLDGPRRYTLPPRAWRDGLGLLYDLPGLGGLEAVLRYVVRAATAEPGTDAALQLWAWVQSMSARAGLLGDFQQMLTEEFGRHSDARGPGRTVLLEIVQRGWEPEHCDWSVSISRGEDWTRLESGERSTLAELSISLRAPLAEAMRRCDGPDQPAVLEVALPANLLSLDVDTWPLDRAGGLALGATRPVVIRCADRDLAPGWDEERMRRWSTLHHRPPVPTVLDASVTGENLLRSLPPDALPVLSGSRDAALRALLEAGLPIALWRRDHDVPKAPTSEFRQRVQHAVEGLTSAAELPDRLLSLRKELAAHSPDASWADGLTLLYDDPTSPLPDDGDLLEAP
ncbi:serine protease [Streptomyces cinnabarinus]|uniref:Serine protease n=1 Tax=Streptomyces cinnabarinus TaxID=67287 RepID=A0ABY7KR15_9ACTN|nr:SAV_2336 N-terminal domain-related protein [Streptomyces cinnabarinus]WAZ27014.1 serine protease [Streptomyces cinnabarinus]